MCSSHRSNTGSARDEESRSSRSSRHSRREDTGSVASSYSHSTIRAPSQAGSRATARSSNYSGSSSQPSRISSRALVSSRTRSGITRSAFLPGITEVDDSDEWASEDERYVLSEWQRQRPTSTVGTRYEDRLIARVHPRSNYEAIDHSARYGPSSRTASITHTYAPRISSRSNSSYYSRDDSGSEDDRTVRLRGTSRRSSVSRSGHTNDNELSARLSHMSIGHSGHTGYESDEEMVIPSSYRAPRPRRSSNAGSSTSHHGRSSSRY